MSTPAAPSATPRPETIPAGYLIAGRVVIPARPAPAAAAR